MTRMVLGLAVATGISPRELERLGWDELATLADIAKGGR